MPENFKPDMIQIAIHGFAALFGAIANTMKCEKKTFWSIMTSFIVSSFSGFIFGLLAVYFFGDQTYLTTAIAGAGGFLGNEGMVYISKAMLKALKVNIDSCKLDK